MGMFGANEALAAMRMLAGAGEQGVMSEVASFRRQPLNESALIPSGGGDLAEEADIWLFQSDGGFSLGTEPSAGRPAMWWDGSRFVADKSKSKKFPNHTSAQDDVPKAMKAARRQIKESTMGNIDEANPYHDRDTGRFTSVPGIARKDGTGSLALPGHPLHKRKGRGSRRAKSGKVTINWVRTPTVCGRAARRQGKDVLCWTGRDKGTGMGQTQRHNLKQPKKGGKQYQKGGRGPTRAPNYQRMRREGMEEAVRLDVDALEFVIDASDPKAPRWELAIDGTDKAAVVEIDGDSFVWASFDGDEVVASGRSATLEDAWARSSHGAGVFEVNAIDEVEDYDTSTLGGMVLDAIRFGVDPDLDEDEDETGWRRVGSRADAFRSLV